MCNRPDLGMYLRFNSVAIIALFQRPWIFNRQRPAGDDADPARE
jgi:hypothetical protein